MVEDLTGNRYGRLTVICLAPKKPQPSGQIPTKWTCLCDCGKYKNVSAYNLKIGKTKSCGCYNSEVARARMTKHGDTSKIRYNGKDRLYRIWSAMKERCYNKKAISYKNYGGKGIKVCEEWVHSYESFKKWAIANGYSCELSIDRIDNEKDYSPSNCRWATRVEQNNNTSRNKYITAFGKTQTLAQWGREFGISSSLITQRINKLGWDIEKALKEPVRGRSEK